MCKHRSWGFDCWDSLKTTLGGSHPKYKYSEYSILKPLLPGLERGKAILTAPYVGEKKEGRKEEGGQEEKVFLTLREFPKSLALVA